METKGNKTLDKRLIKKETGKYGKGVFAKTDINKGEVIHILGGKKIPLKEVVRRVNSGEENIDDIFQIGKRTYIDLDEISRTFNHSCDPTGGIRKTSELFALKNIKRGEEITYDYSLTIAPTEWKMRCKCGSKNCRKTLGDIRTIPKKRLDEYKKLGAIQDYMKKLLTEIESGTYKIPAYEKEALENLNHTHNVVSVR